MVRIILVLSLLATLGSSENEIQARKNLSVFIDESSIFEQCNVFLPWLCGYRNRIGNSVRAAELPVQNSTIIRIISGLSPYDASSVSLELAKFKDDAALVKELSSAASGENRLEPKVSLLIAMFRLRMAWGAATIGDSFIVNGGVEESVFRSTEFLGDIETARKYRIYFGSDIVRRYCDYFNKRQPESPKLLEMEVIKIKDVLADVLAVMYDNDTAPVSIIWLVGRMGDPRLLPFMIKQININPTMRHAISLGSCLSQNNISRLIELNDAAFGSLNDNVLHKVGLAPTTRNDSQAEIINGLNNVLIYCLSQSFPQ